MCDAKARKQKLAMTVLVTFERCVENPHMQKWEQLLFETFYTVISFTTEMTFSLVQVNKNQKEVEALKSFPHQSSFNQFSYTYACMRAHTHTPTHITVTHPVALCKPSLPALCDDVTFFSLQGGYWGLKSPAGHPWHPSFPLPFLPRWGNRDLGRWWMMLVHPLAPFPTHPPAPPLL